MPSEFAGALAQRVRKPQALLIANHLVGCRLPYVDDGLARQVGWLDQFGLHGRAPPEPRRGRRRLGAAEPVTVLPKSLLDLCPSSSETFDRQYKIMKGFD